MTKEMMKQNAQILQVIRNDCLAKAADSGVGKEQLKSMFYDITMSCTEGEARVWHSFYTYLANGMRWTNLISALEEIKI